MLFSVKFITISEDFINKHKADYEQKDISDYTRSNGVKEGNELINKIFKI